MKGISQKGKCVQKYMRKGGLQSDLKKKIVIADKLFP